MHRCVKAAATLAHRHRADRGFPCGYRVATTGATLNVLWQQFAGRVKGAIAAGASAVLVGIRSADDGVGPDYVTSVLTALQVSQSRAHSQVVACPLCRGSPHPSLRMVVHRLRARSCDTSSCASPCVR